jgi:hypothetical protein
MTHYSLTHSFENAQKHYCAKNYEEASKTIEAAALSKMLSEAG